MGSGTYVAYSSQIANAFSLLPDFEVYDVDASDPDGDNVTYIIPVNSLNSQYFRVDSATGVVFTRPGVILDREVSSEITPSTRSS